MKPFIAALILAVTALVPASAEASPPVDNYGQCAHFLVSIGVNPSEFRPPLIEAGPSVIFYNEDGSFVRVVGAKAFDFGVACHYEIPQ